MTILSDLKCLCKGIIIETDSSIIIKDEEGNDLRLKVLKNPIDINSLECNNEECENNILKYQSSFKGKVRNNDPDSEINIPFENILTKPLSLDELQEGDTHKNSIRYKKKIRKELHSIRSSRQVPRNSISVWKQNALTIFEHSSVYPFVHAFNKYKCFICAKVFLDSLNLRDHFEQFHNFNDVERELNNRARDKNLKVDVNLLKCNICSKHFDNLQSLKVDLLNHGKNIDPDVQDNIIPFKLGGHNFECQICRESFQKLRILIIHMSIHFNNYSCERCGTSFISLHLLKRHLQTHKIGNYPCEKCDKVFNNSAKRTLHFRSVHLKQFLRICPICPERFNSNYQRTKHLRIVHNHNTELYKCETCGREYDLKYQLLVHIRSVHMQERNHECNMCHARFFSKYCLSRHMVVHTGEKKFKCDVCGKCYARLKNLKDHIKTHENFNTCTLCGQHFSESTTLADHMDAHLVSSSERPTPRTSIWQMTIYERLNAATFLEWTTVKPFFYQQANFKCFYCNEVFPEIHSVLQHTEFHSVPERSSLLKQYLRKGKRVIKVDISCLKCRICDHKYNDLDDIRKHLITTHKKEFNSAGNGLMAYNLTISNGLLACHKCGKTYNSFFLLNRHMNAHFSVVCETCGLGFISHQRLINHRVVHQNGVHKCDKCQDIFPTKLKLRYHMFKKHEVTNAKRIKPLKCPHCLERFAEHYRKMSHLKDAHGIIFTFECQVCKSVFPTRRALTEHTTKQHTRKIQCKVCEKCFGTKSLLKMHMRGHTGERNFCCNICQKAYMHERTLRQHMRVHGPVWKFMCSECGSGFHNRNDYNRHMKQWHPQWQFKTNVKIGTNVID